MNRRVLQEEGVTVLECLLLMMPAAKELLVHLQIAPFEHAVKFQISSRNVSDRSPLSIDKDKSLMLMIPLFDELRENDVFAFEEFRVLLCNTLELLTLFTYFFYLQEFRLQRGEEDILQLGKLLFKVFIFGKITHGSAFLSDTITLVATIISPFS